jgi:DNA-binding NarL/FixJ family response regulator
MPIHPVTHDSGRSPSGSDDRQVGEHPTRIFLVDDHPVVRQGIKQILTEAFHPVQVGEAESAAEALTGVRTAEWDVVVLDLTMPGVNGLELLRDIRRERPELPILVLSMHPADQFARRTMNAGASGYLTKHTGPTELVRAVDTLIGGGLYVGPVADPAHPVEGGQLGTPLHERLSDREYQVLRMIALGKTVSQIAAETSLSVKTVSTYRARVLEKMNMHTTAELMRYAIVNHLVD